MLNLPRLRIKRALYYMTQRDSGTAFVCTLFAQLHVGIKYLQIGYYVTSRFTIDPDHDLLSFSITSAQISHIIMIIYISNPELH